jgi:hypothetical protein
MQSYKDVIERFMTKNILFSGIFSLVLVVVVGCATETSTPAPPPTLPPPKLTQPAPQPTETVMPLGNQPALDAPAIAFNELKEGTLADPDAVDNWVFSANAGERVSIVLNSQFDNYLELFDPTGELIASNDDSGDNLNAALFDVLLNKTGQHVIKIRGYNGQTGPYAVALTGGHPTIGGGSLNAGETRAAVLSEQGYKWRYQGQEGDYLSIKAQGEPGIDPFLAVYGPDGTVLVSDDDSGGGLNPEIIDYELPASGLYTVRAHTINSTGLVTLTLNVEGQSSGGGPLVLGKSQVGQLKPGRVHRWNFEGQSGQVINLSMVSSEFDTFLELRDAADSILAENDDGPDGTNAVINAFSLPGDGVYTAIARSLSNDEAGEYEITLKQVKVAAGGGTLEPDQTLQVSLAPNQIDTWEFSAEADTYVTIAVNSDQIDTYLELFDPEDRLLTADDDSGGGLNATILDFPVTESGVYKVVVKPSRQEGLQSGIYEISMAVMEDLASTGQLEADQPITRDLLAGEQHTWTFSAEEDTFVTVRMNSETLDTYLALYDDTGELLYINDDFFAKQAAITNFIVPRDGDYRVVARAYSSDENGEYTISLSITDEEQPISPAEIN